ncbi:MAG: potassium-transporting ATPase subunit C [Blastocatellia bacterium]
MKDLITSALMIVVFTISLGLVYPLAVWSVGQVIFPHQANGSLIKNEKGEIIGSELIGQQFSAAEYFHSRPSEAGIGYDAVASSGSNLGPTSKKLIERVETEVDKLNTENSKMAIPADLVTTSASGLDPHISPAAAEFQIPRVAKQRNISEPELQQIVQKFTEGRRFGILGEPRVNVLLLNLELDKSEN